MYIDRDGSVLDCILSHDAFQAWVLFDVTREDGTCLADELLRADKPLSAGERRYLHALRQTVLRPYEVVDVVPGSRLELRDVLDGGTIVVDEVVVSCQLQFGDLVAARVVREPNRRPELIGGYLPQYEISPAELGAELRAQLVDMRRAQPGASLHDLLKRWPPRFHQRWHQWRSRGYNAVEDSFDLREIERVALKFNARERWLELEEERLHHQHVRWLDEAHPALQGFTPRQAAVSAEARPALLGVLDELMKRYRVALRRCEPAFDPSWIWEHLDLVDEPKSPGPLPPLGHEMWAVEIPGLLEVARGLADDLRKRLEPSIPPTYTREELVREPTFRRFVAEQSLRAALQQQSASPAHEWDKYASTLEVCCNFELHLRKVFWVDSKLSYLLSETDPDVTGADLRLPFPSFAVVLTDRTALGFAERMVSRTVEDARRRTQMRAVTAYVTELAPHADRRHVRMTLACDALDFRAPLLIQRDLWIAPDDRLDALIDHSRPRPGDGAPITVLPARRLFRVVAGAILYATGAKPAIERREPPSDVGRAGLQHRSRGHHTSESIYHLGGTIDITMVRRLQRAIRGSSAELTHRSLVRGHFRDANPDWVIQKRRFIEPYWRGPEDSLIVERDYRLRP